MVLHTLKYFYPNANNHSNISFTNNKNFKCVFNTHLKQPLDLLLRIFILTYEKKFYKTPENLISKGFMELIHF